jgi:GT2 family glycosyltransferase
VAVILVNWNGSTETLACLRSLQESEGPVWRTYVVDNASTDGSAEILRRTAAKAQLIRSETNLGYAGAFNLAWPAALRDGAEYVWLLNNDTQVTRTALTHLLEAAVTVGPALLSPQIRYQDRPEKIWYLGGRLDWRMKTFHITHRDPSPTAQSGGVAPVEWATGCSLFMSAHALEMVGAMDERYFLYLEDVDWSLSARRRG